MADIAEVTDATFGDMVFKSATPVLVEFWAAFAAQCGLAEPLLLAAAGELGAAVRLMRLDVERSPMAAVVYGVRRVPLLILFRQGEELDRWSGALPAEEIVERVRAACGGAAAASG